MSTPYTPFLVGNQRTAIDLGIDPWLTPKDAYLQMYDAYQFRGVVTKRDGYTWFDVMPYCIGTQYQNIASITNLLTGPVLVTTSVPHGLESDQFIRITDCTGSAATLINGVRFQATVLTTTTFNLKYTTSISGSINSNTGTLSALPCALTLNPSSINIGNPIMAIAYYLDPQNVSHILVLDTERAAIYDPSQGCLKPIGFTRQFYGDQKNLFWWENYRGVIYFTNNYENSFTAKDSSILTTSMFYWNDWVSTTPVSTQLATGLAPFTPQISFTFNTFVVQKSLMIKSANNRLVLYNLSEVDPPGPLAHYSTRIRWSVADVDTITGVDSGEPPPIPDLGSTAWFGDVPAFPAGYADLVGSLNIISQGQIQTNNLVISQNQQFASIYEQRPTSDPQNPFSFVKIAVSRSVDSTFGTIVLDRDLQLMGSSGLVLTDGNSFARFDDNIPDFTVNVISQDNFYSAFGIRNDPQWQTWTAFCSQDAEDFKNDQVLVFNYQDRSFQLYRLSMASFGLVPNPGDNPTWQSYTDETWADLGNDTWRGLPQQNAQVLLGGGYDGNIWFMNNGGGDAAQNVAYNNIVPPGYTILGNPITMELETRQWFPFGQQATACQFGYIDLLIDGDPTTVVGIEFYVDNQQSPYATKFFTCIPFENLQSDPIEFITQDSNAVVTSYAHGLQTGQLIYIYGVQGMIEINGLSTIITVINIDTFSCNDIDSSSFTTYISAGIITEKPIENSVFWTRIMSGQTGVFHQMSIVAQGTNESFKLHALIFYAKPSGRIYRQ